MKLHVKPNDVTGYWEIHDECEFLCHLESESTAALIVHAANVLPELIAALEMAEPAVEYHHDHEGCPITRRTVRAAIKHANNLNPRRPSPAHKTKGTKPYGRNS